MEKDYGSPARRRPTGWQAVLARYRFDAVLWPRTEALASLIAEDPGWTVRISDRRWVVAVRDHVPSTPTSTLNTQVNAGNFPVRGPDPGQVGADPPAGEFGEKCASALRIRAEITIGE